jgi:hypothetical protein
VHVVRVDEPTYSFTLQCLVTASLPGGRITSQGLLTFTNGAPEERFTFAVTGGTRRYEGVRGEVRVRLVTETESKFVFRLRR